MWGVEFLAEKFGLPLKMTWSVILITFKRGDKLFQKFQAKVVWDPLFRGVQIYCYRSGEHLHPVLFCLSPETGEL